MGQGLKPDWQLRSVLDIDLDRLQKMNRKNLIFDLDNTLTGWNSYDIPPEIENWMRDVKGRAFQVMILSNNDRERIAAVADRLEIPFMERAGKPKKGSYLQAVRKLGVPKNQVAMIGDQIFTDVFGANRVGLFTILVDPMDKKEYWGTKISRFFEYTVMGRRPCTSGKEKAFKREPSEKQA